MGKLFPRDAYNKDASLQLVLLILNTARDIGINMISHKICEGAQGSGEMQFNDLIIVLNTLN